MGGIESTARANVAIQYPASAARATWACLISQGLTVDDPDLAVHLGQTIYKDVMTGGVSAPYEAQLRSRATGLSLDKANETVACALSNNPWDLR